MRLHSYHSRTPQAEQPEATQLLHATQVPPSEVAWDKHHGHQLIAAARPSGSSHNKLKSRAMTCSHPPTAQPPRSRQTHHAQEQATIAKPIGTSGADISLTLSLPVNKLPLPRQPASHHVYDDNRVQAAMVRTHHQAWEAVSATLMMRVSRNLRLKRRS